MEGTNRSSAIEAARDQLHQDLAGSVLAVKGSKLIGGREVPVLTNADGHSDLSVYLAAGMAELLPAPMGLGTGGSAAGAAFETAVMRFLASSLDALRHLSPWAMETGPGRLISEFAQYEHLDDVQSAVKANPELEAAIGGDYLVRPDIVVSRAALDERQLNEVREVVGGESSLLSPVRRSNAAGIRRILHATISCKWTIRSDRVQNTRTEALNLVRNRKGRTPHIVAATAEPLPSRLASIAVGTGDIDCVYHVALDELERAARMGAESFGGSWAAAHTRLSMMIESSRLRDISDMPLDLLA